MASSPAGKEQLDLKRVGKWLDHQQRRQRLGLLRRKKGCSTMNIVREEGFLEQLHVIFHNRNFVTLYLYWSLLFCGHKKA